MQRAANPWDRFYRRHTAPWRGERAVAELLPWLGAGPVLELGCGNGKTLKPLLAGGVDVVGLDISFHILRRHGRKGALVLGDAVALPFRAEAFTAVLDFHCTGHLPGAGRREAAAEALRVLRIGGHLLAERLTPNDLRASQGTSVPGEPGMRVVEDGRATQFSGAGDLVREFEAAGFTAEGGIEERHHPGHRGRQVTREVARMVFRKPDAVGSATPRSPDVS